MKTHRPNSRRAFIRQAAGISTAAAVFPRILSRSILGAENRVAPNDRIHIGVIGTGNQGSNDIRSMLPDERVQIVAVCDVNRESPGYWDGNVAGREPARRMINEFYAKQANKGSYKGCDVLSDFRELLARKDIDAVMIATPDH